MKRRTLMQLVLASGSSGRKMLMQRLQIPFVCVVPDIDESIHLDEDQESLVMRLARAKAEKVKTQLQQNKKQQGQEEPSLIIAADQIASIGQTILNKPGTRARAKKQLEAISGQQVTFITGLCVLHQKTSTRYEILSPYTVRFRVLGTKLIDAYLDKEQPYQCAGSFKSEGLGIVLVRYFKGDDPSSLIGLPLTHLTSILTTEGINILPAL